MSKVSYPIKFSINLTPITKKNHQNIYKTKEGRRFITPSKQYQNYEAAALWLVPKVPGRPITDRINIQYRFVVPTLRLCDLTNLEESIDDILVKAGSLPNYKDVAESAMICLDEGFESSMTVMTLPKGLRRFFRTSNHIERLNKELKRRSRVIGIFPNEASLLRLMGSVLIERNSICQVQKAIFSDKTYQKLIESDIRQKLHLIAEEQTALLAA